MVAHLFQLSFPTEIGAVTETAEGTVADLVNVMGVLVLEKLAILVHAFENQSGTFPGWSPSKKTSTLHIQMSKIDQNQK